MTEKQKISVTVKQKPRRNPKKLPLADRIPDPPKRELSPAELEARRQNLMLAAGARLKKKVLAARKSPEAFIEFAFRDQDGNRLKLQPFHREWLEHFARSSRVQIEASRSHGKTTIVLGYVLWRIGTNPDIRIKYFAQSEEKARERLSVVGHMITTSKLVKLVFPHLKPGKGVWHKTAIQVERSLKDPNPTMGASGIMGSVEGGRCDLCVFDDVADYRSSIVYPQHRENIKKKVYAEILPMIEEKGSAISVATPHHEMDCVASLRKNPEWESYVYGVGIPEDPTLPIWPERWPRRALQRLRNEIGPLEYDRAYRCIAISGNLSFVKAEHIKYYDAEILGNPWDLVCVQAYDLAGVQKRKSSYFACVTLLYNPDKGLVFVADAWQAKISFTDQARAIVAEAAKWQPDRIVIEQTGYQGALREYLIELAKNPLPVYPITPGSKSKELRLAETLPMFEAGRILFNPALDSGMNPERSAKGDIIGQLLDFTQAADQDLGDAFAYGVKALRYFQTDDDDEDWEEGGGVTTRLSVIG
jgi:phage terminase large subunit-like protein